MPHVGLIAAVGHVDERGGLVELDYLLIGRIVRWHHIRFGDIKGFEHVLGLVVLTDRWQPHLLFQAKHPQGEFRLNLDPLFGVIELIGLQHRVGQQRWRRLMDRVALRLIGFRRLHFRLVIVREV